mgnify:FL=1
MGLNDNEVINSRKKYGSNEITKKNNNTFINLLLESLGDPIIKILLIALAIKIVVMFKDFDWYETLGILIAILLASFISSISEYGSEKAFARLQSETSKLKARVKRNNKVVEIYAKDIVVGDIVLLQSGDKIPADGKIVRGNITADESALNGETKEALKIIGSNVYAGTIIYTGEAEMETTAVGDKTILGKISEELQENIPDSPLKLKLRSLAGTISKIGYAGAILASLAFLFSQIVMANNYDMTKIVSTLTDFPKMFDLLIYALTLSVTIIVVAVPEGLPVMITLVLSSNMKRMLKDNVLVRKMVGIETAGSLNVLLTDKTGTLTKGMLEVTEFISSDLKSYKTNKALSQSSIYYHSYIAMHYNNSSTISDKKIIGGNSTDRAVLAFINKDDKIKVKVIEKEPFDSQKKYSSIKTNEGYIYYKGAREVLLSKCHKRLDSMGKEVYFSNKSVVEKRIDAITKAGGRVLVLAYGKSFNDLIYLGIISIKDELRKEAIEGVKLIKKAGIKTIMITGDAKETAREIAKEVGLLSINDLVIDSKKFNEMSDEEVAHNLQRISVIARALPQDKSRLVNIVESMNLVVGMTGDGVNDAPALKKADVGFAMGSGTDVAKEAADIVILDNNILSISKAILYGRTIFKSIRKFIVYQLTINMCALILSIVGSLVGISTPITIVQMLWLNMIMDTFAGIAFSFEAPLKEYMDELPKDKNTKIINKYMYSQILWTGAYSALLCLLFLKLPFFSEFIRYDAEDKYLLTTYFAMFIFIGIFNAFNARTTRINIFAGLSQNKVFIFIFIFIFLAQLWIIYNGHDIFRTYGLLPKELALSLLLALTVFPVDYIRKYLLKLKHIDIKI